MLKSGFERSKFDNCVYVRRHNGSAEVYLLLYVDDMLVASVDHKQVDQVKVEPQKEFEMELGEAKRILGVDILRNKDKGELLLYQSAYVDIVLRKFNMNESKSLIIPLSVDCKLSKKMSPKTKEEELDMVKVSYASVVGSIMYIMLCSRPDLSHSISLMSRFMANPGRKHWEALKRVLVYIPGTRNVGIMFRKALVEGDRGL